MQPVDTAYGDVLSCCHLEAHEVLKDDTDISVQIFNGIFPQVNTVQQYLSFGGVVEARDQLDYGCLTLAVFSYEGDPFAGRKCEIEVFQHGPLCARISEGDIAKLEAILNRLRCGQGPGFGLDGRLDIEERDEVGEKERLIGDA